MPSLGQSFRRSVTLGAGERPGRRTADTWNRGRNLGGRGRFNFAAQNALNIGQPVKRKSAVDLDGPEKSRGLPARNSSGGNVAAFGDARSPDELVGFVFHLRPT